MSATSKIERPYAIRQLHDVEDARRLFREHLRSWRTLGHRLSKETAANNSFSLRGINTVLDTAAKPSRAHDRNFSEVQLLRNKLSVLENMIHQLRVTFMGDKNAERLITLVEKLRQSVQQKYDEKEKSLAEKTQAIISPAFTTTFKSVERWAKKTLEGRYEDVKTQVLSGTVEGSTQVSGYILFKGLKGSDGFNHDEFYIIVSQVTDENKGIRRYITILHTFALPGHFGFDAEGDSAEKLKQLVNDQLSVQGFMSVIAPRKLTVDRAKIKVQVQGVKGLVVKDDKIIVRLLPNADWKAVRDAVKIQLLSIFRSASPKSKDVLRDSYVPAKKGSDYATITFAFTLPGNLKARVLSKPHMTALQRALHINTKGDE